MKVIISLLKKVSIWSFVFLFCFLSFNHRDNHKINDSKMSYEEWLNNVMNYIKESEYDIRWQERSEEYQSPNRSHNLRFSYYEDGFKVCPREDRDKWEVKIMLKEYGKDKNIEYKGKGLKVQKNKGYVKGNGIDIVFVNNEKGMREDFIVNKRPEGEGELILQFEVKMDKVMMGIDGKKISFGMDVPGGAEVLRYGDMKITDKEGKELKGEFRIISDNRFAIVIDDKDAIYPITIDPLSSAPNWIGESNQANAYYGYSVATAGDVNGDGYSDVIIGASDYDNGEGDEGAAFLYYGSPTGLSSTPDWTGESNQDWAYYGYSVATAGDVNGDGYSDVIISAYKYDNLATDVGAVFLYYGSQSGLSSTPDWTGQSGLYQDYEYYGYSVSIAGDVNGDGYSDIIIGAFLYYNVENNEGAAFLYYGSPTGLSLTPDWTGESNQDGAYYGFSFHSRRCKWRWIL